MHALPDDIAKYKGKYDQGYDPIRRAQFKLERQMGLISRDWDLSKEEGDWAKVRNKEWEAGCMEVYAAMIDRMDQNIGRIIQTSRLGQLDNTLVLFLQDNGGNYEPVGRGKPPAGPPVLLKPQSDDYIQMTNRPDNARCQAGSRRSGRDARNRPIPTSPMAETGQTSAIRRFANTSILCMKAAFPRR